MIDRLVKEVMEPMKALALSPEITVSKAAELMARNNIGAAMIVEQERLVGVFTERDALFRVVAKGLDSSTTRLAAVMTPNPRTVSPTMSYGHALVVMQENGFRHLPVVEGGKPVGIVSSRSAMDPELEDFVSEARRREYLRVGH
jgi:CBS domain-containing protein